MTLNELDQLLEDTLRMPRAQDKVQLNLAIRVIEIARQLTILNANLAGQEKPKSAGKGK